MGNTLRGHSVPKIWPNFLSISSKHLVPGAEVFFLESLEIDRALRQLRGLHGPIIEDLRGWNWSNDVLSPPIEGIYLGVSEIANRYCPTYRDIYLKRVLGTSAPYTYKTVRGWIYHAVCKKIVEKAKSKLYASGLMNGSELYSTLIVEKDDLLADIFSEYAVSRYVKESRSLERLKKEAGTLYNFLALQAAAKLDRVLSRMSRPDLESVISRIISMDVERAVNGQLLGLSSELKIDMFADKRIVIEIKTGDVRDFHKYAVTGYALAVEADLEIPIDYGIISYIHVNEDGYVTVKNKIHFIGDELRREFIEVRDEIFNVIHRGIDPGKASECPEYCIYYEVCR